MANNLNISEGSGKVLKTDDVAGVHYQGIKLFSALEDSTEAIEGTAANGLEVDVTRMVPGFAASNLGKRTNDAYADQDVGVALLATRKDTPATWAPADGDYVPLRVDAAGRLYVNLDAGGATLLAAIQAATTGGATLANAVVAASGTNATNVKASAGQVYGYYAFNPSAAVRYIKLYDKASAPSPASDTPKWVIGLPAGAAANVTFNPGLLFASGIGFAMVTGISNTDNNGVTAADLVFSLAYK